MARALDHLVLPCRDLATAAERYAALGFTLGRRNQHPWGTENHIIQFDGVFLELIAMAPGAMPPAPEDDAFPFAGFLAGLGSSADPSGMVVLRSADAAEDAALFARQGIGEGRRLDFSRTAVAPDGGSRTVSFSLAFAAAAAMPDIGFFACCQHTPEHFWNPALQRHGNGVTRVDAVVLVARDPAEQAEFLTRFADQPETDRRDGGFAVDLGNSRIEVIDPQTAETLGIGGDRRPARFAAIRFAGASAPHRVVTEDGLVLLFG